MPDTVSMPTSLPCPRCKASEERVTPIDAFGCDRCGAVFTDCTSSSDPSGTELCDVCAGEGTPLSGGVCICGGSGKSRDAVPVLRERLFAITNEAQLLRSLLLEAHVALVTDSDLWRRINQVLFGNGPKG